MFHIGCDIIIEGQNFSLKITPKELEALVREYGQSTIDGLLIQDTHDTVKSQLLSAPNGDYLGRKRAS